MPDDSRRSPPDSFLRDPVEAYVRPVLHDLAQSPEAASQIPPALVEALARRYTISRALGHGGMANVYLALDRSLGRQVAIKVLQSEVTGALSAERFAREIEVTAQFHHSRREGRHRPIGRSARLRNYSLRFCTARVQGQYESPFRARRQFVGASLFQIDDNAPGPEGGAIVMGTLWRPHRSICWASRPRRPLSPGRR